MQTTSAGLSAQELRNATLRSGAERAIIASTFKDNEALLNAIRALFFNVPIDPKMQAKIKGLAPEVREIIRVKLLPELSDYADGPIGVCADPWLAIDQDIYRMPKEVIRQATEVNTFAIEYAKTALALLENPDGPKPDMTVSASFTDEYQIKLLARNKFIRLVNSQLHNLWIVANQVETTPAQQAKKVAKDSSK